MLRRSAWVAVWLNTGLWMAWAVFGIAAMVGFVLGMFWTFLLWVGVDYVIGKEKR